MEKYVGDVKVNTTTGKLFLDDMEIKCPFQIAMAYETWCTFEYLTDNYTNDEETLWIVARNVRELMREVDYPMSEDEAIEETCNSMNITLNEA